MHLFVWTIVSLITPKCSGSKIDVIILTNNFIFDSSIVNFNMSHKLFLSFWPIQWFKNIRIQSIQYQRTKKKTERNEWRFIRFEIPSWLFRYSFWRNILMLLLLLLFLSFAFSIIDANVPSEILLSQT